MVGIGRKYPMFGLEKGELYGLSFFFFVIVCLHNVIIMLDNIIIDMITVFEGEQ
jgi:hypothetical protein